MLHRRKLLMTVSAASAATWAGIGGRASAQPIDMLKIMVPAAPGGGWDQTGRTIEQVLRAIKAVNAVQVTNVAGAGGTVGLPQFVNQ